MAKAKVNVFEVLNNQIAKRVVFGDLLGQLLKLGEELGIKITSVSSVPKHKKARKAKPQKVRAKRKISKAGRAAIAKAQRKRWAKVKAAKKKAAK
jgi:hypothetical protein